MEDKPLLITGTEHHVWRSIVSSAYTLRLQFIDHEEYDQLKEALREKRASAAFIGLDYWRERGFVLYLLAKRAGIPVIVFSKKETLADLEWYCQFEEEDVMKSPVDPKELSVHLHRLSGESLVYTDEKSPPFHLQRN
jgi:hypothetical protein